MNAEINDRRTDDEKARTTGFVVGTDSIKSLFSEGEDQ